MWERVIEGSHGLPTMHRAAVPGGWLYVSYNTTVFVPKTARDLEAAYEEGFEDGKQTMRELLDEAEKVKPSNPDEPGERFGPNTPPDIAYNRGYNDGQREALKKED